ncbi:MAG: right-handed parallel beta-helix repeat-containing protein [Clostridia bacterium]|nr:right-handed parallel beta-helix repeat-containing protein [Clostridia bacterium]
MAYYVTKKTTEQTTLPSLAEVKESILSAAAGATPQNKVDVVVELGHGRYFAEEPLVLDTAVSPELANVSLTIKAAPSMRPTVTGLRNIRGAEFVPVAGKPYYKYRFEKDEKGEYPKFRDFFVGDARMSHASSPIWANPFSFLPEERRGEKKLEGLYVPYGIAEAAKKAGVGKMQVRMSVQWEHAIMNVKDIDLSVTKDVDGKPYALVTFFEEFDSQFVCGIHRANNIGGRPTYFINNTAFLTEPGSFVYDHSAGTVYVVPPKGCVMEKAVFRYTTLSTYIELRGMKDVTVDGIDFVGLTSPFASLNGYFGMLSNAEFRVGKLRHAAITTSMVRNVTIKNCTFRSMGTNGVQLCDRAVKVTVEGCVFKDVGMSGVDMGNYRVGKGWADESNRLYRIKVTNNYFTHVAYDYPSTSCIWLGYCDTAEISHNTIDGCAYSGISAGDGYSKVGFEVGESVNLRNVEICYNRIRNFMDICRDGAAIYVTGANCSVSCEERFNSIHHNYALLEAETAKDYNCRGYYLDGAASNWDVYDNVIDNCILPLFTQYHVPGQYTHHNLVKNFYSTTWVDEVGNNRPFHDTRLENCVVIYDLNELFEKHPEAKAIADGAGCRF